MAIYFFLRIAGVQGESPDAKHKGEIPVLSWSWGESNANPPDTGSGAGAGKPSLQDFAFDARSSSASPVLMQACLTSRRFASAVLTGRRATGTKGQRDF